MLQIRGKGGTSEQGMTESLQVVTGERDAASHARVLSALERQFSRRGFAIAQTTSDPRPLTIS